MEFELQKLRVGMTVKGEVFKVTDDVVYVDVKSFTDGTIYKAGLSLTPINSCKEVVKEGDIIDVKVTKIDHERQQILLSRIDALRQEKREEFDKEAEKGEVFTAKVKKKTRGGLVLEYNGIELFMPLSQIDIKRVELENINEKTMRCQVIENKNGKVVVSRKKVLLDELNQAKKDELENIEVGQVLEGTVARIQKFGAFVHLNYVDGLLHISELSHHRTKNVTDVVKEGQKVTVKVIEKKNGKLKLSMKALQKTPWEQFAEAHKIGEKVTGKIVRKMANGMLVEVARDVVGMISARDYSWDPRQNLAGTVEVGDELELQILSIDPEARKMGLSKKHLEYNPWKDVTVKLNEEVSGTVEELQTRGALVKIQNVNAFLPIGEITVERVQQVSDVLKVGDIVNGIVTSLDRDNWKMVISVRQLIEQKEREEFNKYLKTEEKAQSQTIGDLFGDKLKDFK